jgi:hypothetical protein
MVLRKMSVAVFARFARALLVCAPGAAWIATPASAAPPTSLDLTADTPLTFGTIVTSGGGSRTVGADGSTSDNGVFTLGSSTSAPAQFTMTFERPPGNRSVYQLVFLFSLPTPSGVNVGGVSGSLSGFTTDLPGIAQLQPGQVATYIVPNCATTSCSVTFHVGATLTVTPATSRTNLTFPLVLQCTVIAVLA